MCPHNFPGLSYPALTRRLLSLAVLFLLACGPGTVNLPSGYLPAIEGRVFRADHKTPIPGAEVKVIGGTIGTLTGQGGAFLLTNLPTGKFVLIASWHPGPGTGVITERLCRPAYRVVDMNDRDMLQFDFVLSNEDSKGSSKGDKGILAGVVVDARTLEPLAGACVIPEDTELGAATDLNGQYHILDVPPGNYTVQASYMGYNCERQIAHVDRGSTTWLDFVLNWSHW